MSRQAIVVRASALVVALAIAGAVVWGYGMTATIIGTFMAKRPETAQETHDRKAGVVTVSVLPAGKGSGDTGRAPRRPAHGGPH